tara:strand:+ start:622 stop:873 length:252 start_codon:yes stop_codon:yes gene_type:complete
MDINTFCKAYTLYKADVETDVTVVVSDSNHDNAITSSTFEAQCEWRQPYRTSLAEPVTKPDSITWSAIEAFKTKAEAVADFSN